MSASNDREILNVDEAAALLGVSVKTFNKVLHSESMPARKIGREWKFSRKALIDWVGGGRSDQFYKESGSSAGMRAGGDQRDLPNGDPAKSERGKRTAGWSIELD
jgi:excisionase family DNA binding protein